MVECSTRIPPTKLAELSRSPSVVADGQGKLVFISQPFEDAFGYEASELLGQLPPYPWWPPEGVKLLMELFGVLLRSGGAGQGSVTGGMLTLVRPDGGRVQALARCGPITSTGGETLFALSYELEGQHSEYVHLHDIAERLERAVTAIDQKDSGHDRWSAIVQGADLHVLSARQREVLNLLVQGLRPAAIASTLSISPHTVRNHTKAIFSKLEVHSQLDLIRNYGVGGRKRSARSDDA